MDVAEMVRRIGAVLYRLVATLPPRTDYAGVRISAASSEQPEAAIERIRAALDALAESRPAAFRWVQEEISNVLVTGTADDMYVRGNPFRAVHVGNGVVIDPDGWTFLASALAAEAIRMRLCGGRPLERHPRLREISVVALMVQREVAESLADAELVERLDNRIAELSRGR